MRNRGGLRENPMGQPITPQQLVTSKGHIDRLEIKARISNSTKNLPYVYPGGATIDNHAIKNHDVLLMKKHNKIIKRLKNHPNMLYVSSCNGLNYGDVNGNAELKSQQYIFAGVSLENLDYNNQRTGSGGAAIISGITDVQNTGPFKIPVASLVMWSLSALPEKGLKGVSSRNQYMGQPSGKALPILEEYDPLNVSGSISGIWFMLNGKKTRDFPGVKDVTFQDTRKNPYTVHGRTTTITGMQNAAVAVRDGLMSQVLLGIFGMLKTGGSVAKSLKDAVNGANDAIIQTNLLNIAKQLGMFEGVNSNAQSVLQYMVGNNLGLFGSSKGYSSPAVRKTLQNFKLRHVAGDPRRVINRDFDIMTRESMSILFGGISAADAKRRERIIGISQKTAEAGESMPIFIK